MSDLAQVIERLGRMEGKQDTALAELSALAQGAQDRERRIGSLEETVYGNGQAGLKTQVTTIKTACEQRHAPKPGAAVLRGVAQTVIAAVILAVAAALVGLWKSHN